MVADDKLQPAGLKFSKCSDHVEFTRGPFFFLQNICGCSEVSRVIFLSLSSNPKTDGKGITTFFRRTAGFFVWFSITNTSSPAVVACIMNDFGTISCEI